MLRRRCDCEHPPAHTGYIRRCRHGFFWRCKMLGPVDHWVRVPGWRARWALMRSLRRAMAAQQRAGFRRAFSHEHSEDFFCSNRRCKILHKVF